MNHKDFLTVLSVESDVMNDFIAWLQKQLDDRGWGYNELGRRSGQSGANVSYVMTRKQRPTFDFCAAIAGPLGEAPEAMFRRAGLLPNMPPIQDATWRELSDIMRDMTPDERQHVIDYAKWLRRRNRNQT